MTALQLNSELFRELNIIVTDEGMMEKAIIALRRITKPRVKKSKTTAVDNNAVVDLPESFKRLRGMGHFTQEDIDNDERLAYILSK